MALRVTQQSVELLSEATGGKLRVTQFYLEVLGEPGAAPDVSQTLGITDLATETVVPGGIAVSASSSLGITDAATAATDRPRSVSDNLGLTDVATGFNDVPVSASSALALVDQVNRVFDVSAASALAFTDTAYQNIKNLDAANSLALSDIARQNIQNQAVNDTLAFTQTANDSAHVFASSALTLTDTASQRIKEVSASSALSFGQSASAVVIHNLEDSLSFDDAVSRALTLPRTVSSGIEFVQTVELFIDRNGVLCNYSPIVGTGPITIDTTPPTITPSTLTLFWPIVSPTVTVVLRNPAFGNKIAWNANRINRKSRGGTIQVFRDPEWPQFTLLSMDMTLLSDVQIDDLQSFLGTTLGLQVGLKDHDGFMWKGIITTPDTAITQIAGSLSCPNYATSLQFEGELIT